MSRKSFYLDLLERTLWTAIQAAVAVVIETGIDDFHGWAVVRNAAILAALKALAVNRLPWTADNSASTLPAAVDPPAGGPRRDARGRFAREGGHADVSLITCIACVWVAVILTFWAFESGPFS